MPKISESEDLLFDESNSYIPEVYSPDGYIKIVLTIFSRRDDPILIKTIGGLLINLKCYMLNKGSIEDNFIVLNEEISPHYFLTIELKAKPKRAQRLLKISPVIHYSVGDLEKSFKIGPFTIIREDVYDEYEKKYKRKEIKQTAEAIEYRVITQKEEKIEEELLFKIVLVGDGYTGKSSIRLRYIIGMFPIPYLMTIGCDFGIKHTVVKLPDYKKKFKVKYQIWDMGGQQRFGDVRRLYYKGASGAVIVFDMVRLETLLSVEGWVEDIIKSVGKIPIVIVGNKIDLCQGELPCVDDAQIETIIENIKDFYEYDEIPFIKTSAKYNENITEVFDTLGQLIVKRIIRKREAEEKKRKKKRKRKRKNK